ncbi:MAG: DNA-formamidopyrimidine glycosylase [bacterium]|nr:DNA-formamidopyrimidine glycosylase [bacterium]
MPELPEVETVRKTLEHLIVSKTIQSVQLFYPKMIQGDCMDFQNHVTNQTIQSIKRVGKYLFFHFQEGIVVSHLRMEGKYYVQPASDPIQKHVHVLFSFQDGQSLRYHDVRKFGTMEWIPLHGMKDYVKKHRIGLEPFDSDFTMGYLQAKLSRTTKMIKPVLLDQTIVAGLGNIYVDEVLFICGLHPETRVHQLHHSDIEHIISASQAVLGKAIELGGTTIRSYVSSLGVSGRFQNELLVHMRKGEPCYSCGTFIEKIKVGGRGTYVCPTCQTKRG